jgi:hypothetical protein
MSETTHTSSAGNGATPPPSIDSMTLPEAAPQEVLDDIASLTVSSDNSVLTGTREILTKVFVRKPKKDEYFRTHPTAYKGPYIIYEEKSQMETEIYLVAPNVWGPCGLDILAGHTKRVTLRVTMARSGLLFLHPVVEPDPLRKANEYNETSREIALGAVHQWVRMQADTKLGHYRMWVAEGDLGEPKWPAFDINEMINKAFKGKVIADPKHEIIEALRGKI